MLLDLTMLSNIFQIIFFMKIDLYNYVNFIVKKNPGIKKLFPCLLIKLLLTATFGLVTGYPNKNVFWCGMPLKKKKNNGVRNQHRTWTEGLTIIMQLGLNMAGCIIFCFFVGFYLDKWIGIKGIFTTIFILLGVIGGGYTTYRQIMEIVEEKDRRIENDND